MLFSKTGPSEMRFEAPSACRNRMYVLLPDGRTLTEDELDYVLGMTDDVAKVHRGRRVRR